MSNQTITVNTNYDDASIAGLLNGENIAINGAVLTIDSDVRHAQQSAVVGSLDISATLGGEIVIDGTKVWQIEFDASTGNVPTLGTVGVQNCTGGTSGATGEFLGVWATYPAIPNAAGGAMPSTGIVKFRSKVGAFVDNEVVTLPGGATVTVNSATGGRRSWIEVAAEGNNNVSIPRLGKLTVLGDWFELGVTNGADDQTFDLPVLDSLPAFWMETAVGSGVYEKWLNAGCRWGTATQYVQTDLRGKYFGQWREQAANATIGSAVVTMASTAGFVVRAPVQNTNISTAATLADGTCINSIVANTSVTISSTATATAAVTFRSIDSKVTIARRASNPCGFKPVSGLRVRIPNVWLANTNTANYAGSSLPAGAGARYEILASASGVIDISNTVCNWYLNVSNAYSLDIENFAQGCSGNALFNIGNSPTRNIVTNAAWGIEGLLATNPVSITSAFAGVTLTDCRATRAWGGDNGAGVSTSGTSTFNVTDSVGVVMIDCQAEMFESSAGGTTHANTDKRSFIFSRVSDLTLVRPVSLGGEFSFGDVSNVRIVDPVWGDNLSTSTSTTNGLSVGVFSSFSSRVLWTGLQWFGGGTIADIHPYDFIFNVSTQSYNNRFRSIGTPSVPLVIGTNPVAGICSVTQSVDNEFNQIYISNHRSALANASSSSYRTLVDNCWGGVAAVGYIPSNDTRLRGVLQTMGTLGQSAIYGSHWADIFTSTTTGRLLIAANEPSAASVAQCYVTAGTPRFTGSGSVSMPVLGDQLVWEMDYLALGYTALANIAPTFTGTLTGNMSYEFQWSLGGAWNGTWLPLTGTDLSGIGAINPSVGFKLKVRATTTTADPTNALTYIRIDLVTDAVSQTVVYPFKYDASGVLPDTTADCRIQIYNVTTSTEVYNAVPGEVNWIYRYYNGTGISSGDTVRVRIACLGKNLFESSAVASATGFSVLGQMSNDSVYQAIGIDGSAVTKFTADYVDDEIDLNVASNFLMAEFYAWWCYNRTTEQGLRLFAGAITAEDAANIRNNTGVLSLKWDNLTSTNVHQTDNIRFYRDDLAYPVKEPTSGGGGIDVVWREKVYVAPSVDYSALPTLAEIESSTVLAKEATVLAVKAKTDNLPATPAAVSDIPTATAVATEVRVELAGELAAVLAMDARMPTDPADQSLVEASILAVPDAVRTNLATELGRIDVGVSTRLAAASYTSPLDSTATQAAASAALTAYDAATGADVPTVAQIADGVWDEVLTGATHNVNASAGRRLRQVTSGIIGDDVAAGPGTGSNQIVLGATASNVDGAYDPGMVYIVAGTGAGQSRIILQYDGATKTATVNRDWKTAPDATSEYVLHGYADIQSVNEGLVRSATSNTVRLNANASGVDGTYVGQIVFIVSGVGADQTAIVTAYNGTTQTATIAGTWATTPNVTSGYAMLPVSPVLLAATNHTGATIPTVTTLTSYTAPDNAGIAAIKAQTDVMPTAAQVADKILTRNLAGGVDGGRTVVDALRAQRNKVAIVGSTLTVYEEDDTTVAWTAQITTEVRDALQSVDPA